ncbi:MAG: hypothetical protein ACI9SP_002773 [Arenicella sp.]|jgi:hypothetical protein
MEVTNIIKNKWIKRGMIACALFCLVLVTVSSLYYKQLVLNPITAWHGFNIAVVSSQTPSSVSGDQTNLGLPKDLANILTPTNENLLASYERVQIVLPSDIHKQKLELMNSIAASESILSALENDKATLDQINGDIQNSGQILESLNQDFASIAAQHKEQLEHSHSLESEATDPESIPNEEQVRQLLTRRGVQTRSSEQRIPKAVLTNIENTTGISSDEINQLMNQ